MSTVNPIRSRTENGHSHILFYEDEETGGPKVTGLVDYEPGAEEVNEKYCYAGAYTGTELSDIMSAWNANDVRSNPFGYRANDAPSRSLSAGDLIVNAEGVHIVRPCGFDTLDLDQADIDVV